jgi:putative membrane-bound dehydrogenase-like protein
MRYFFARRTWIPGFIVCLAVTAAQAGQFKFPTQTLTVPDGFEIELVAKAPLVDRPISGSFDETGRLYVTDSSGSNEKPDKQLEERPHRVVRLEDIDGNGRFDKTIVFADKMMFPEGCLWYDGSLYVAAPPSIWKLTDTNNDGSADQRKEWHQGKTLTGCANDLHGPYLGPDGWIYWCKGAFAKQTYERPGKSPFVSRAAHIFRTRPDGSGLEAVLTGGMDNPVGVAFTEGGERILCGTFFVTHEPGHRDGLIHAVYGGVYGKINDATDDHKKTGDLMPVMTHMGPAAPCSVTRYESRVFGTEYRNNLFACYFNLHKVSRHILEPEGGTFRTKDSDFVTSDNPDFHPTDVIEDADGSVLVIDTGGWYKICCPTSQLSKPDVLGGIYRVRRVGAPKINDPRGLKLAWGKMKAAELAELMSDERPVVCKRAIQEMARQGQGTVAALRNIVEKSKSSEARLNAVWALTRIDDRSARSAVRLALTDQDATVRHAAVYSVSLWRDAEAREQLLTVLAGSNASLQRVAAEALGRIGDQRDVPALLAASATKRDRVLEHSLTYALIELDDAASTAKGLAAGSSEEKRTALIALDQMDKSDLKAATVSPWLASSDPLLRQTAAWVASHHPDWGGELAEFFRTRLMAQELTAADKDELTRQLAQFAHSAEIQELIATSLKTPSAPRPLLLKAMASAGLKESPKGWASGVSECFAQPDEALLRAAVGTARVLAQTKPNAPNFSDALLRIARTETHPADLRLEALAALPNGLHSVDAKLLNFLEASVDPSQPVLTRSVAASVLAKARLNNEQLLGLADTVKSAGPLEMTKLLAAYEHSTNEAVGLSLLAALKEAKGLASLRADVLKPLIAKYPPSVQEQGKALVSMLNVDAARQAAHLEDLVAALKDGDIRRGQLVFNSQKAACASCHAMGYMGGHVGPDLTTIGQVRTERDLLESIVYPSASFVRSFEPFLVTTKSEEVFNGVLQKDAADEIVLATGPATEVRIARADIVEMRPGKVSVMPGGLDEQLSKQELADLVAFLKSTKWGPR